ncbi:Hypothetical predicted protein [Paramuricea clavata]|uniref:Uncharacterized protein n=1 Tax=Paramuricea clavata TaxID=317549 RepID=A0A7D9ISX2_PARCT|nr:Hypothetical predicted protein [Paramuricea clavata]
MALPDKELNKLTNCDLSEWSCDKCKLRTSTNNEEDSVCEDMYDNFRATLKEPTRVANSSATLLDLILVSNKSKIIKAGTLDPAISDHKMIYAIVNLIKKREHPIIKTVKNYKHVDKRKFKSALQNVPWWVCDIFDDLDDVQNAWELLYKDVNWEQTKNPIAHKKSKEARNLANIRMRKAEAEYWKSEFDNEFWKVVKKVHRKTKAIKIGPLEDDLGNVQINEKEKAELMNNYFATVGEKMAEAFPVQIESE